MTDDEAHALMIEAKMRNDTVQATVELLNLFGQYMSADNGSPIEDQLEATMNDVVNELLNDKESMGGHVFLCLAAIICNAADYDKVQEFLTHQQEAIQEMVDEAHRGHSH
jgi:hypothetical protein